MSLLFKSLYSARLLLICIPALFASDFPTIDTEGKSLVVAKVALIMSETYVDPQSGVDMANHIRHRLDSGAYDDFNDVESFCSVLTSDLRTVTDDKHLFVFHSPEEAREVAASLNLLPRVEIEEIKQRYLEESQADNFGFQKIEILDGNIGCLKELRLPAPAFRGRRLLSTAGYWALENFLEKATDSQQAELLKTLMEKPGNQTQN